jgi:hypothetical protein
LPQRLLGRSSIENDRIVQPFKNSRVVRHVDYVAFPQPLQADDLLGVLTGHQQLQWVYGSKTEATMKPAPLLSLVMGLWLAQQG